MQGVVTNFSDIKQKIIPFIEKYPLEGSKKLDFKDFCEIAEIVKSKDHLTASGLEKIRLIKARMNKGRNNVVVTQHSRDQELLEE